MKSFAVVAVLVSFSLMGFACKNKYATVNVNVNATAQGVVNASKTVNATVATREAAIAAAKAIFIQQEAKGVNFSSGPCLSNSLLTDWVADVAHKPRQAIDDKSENQCSNYANGTAHHFVELDPDGALIQAN